MTRAGVRRLICISALGVGDSRHHGGFIFDRLFQPLLLGPAYKDKDRQEAAIRASSLDWVIIRPAMLTNGAARGRIRATTDLANINGGKIARADVAQFVLEQLTTDTWLRPRFSSSAEVKLALPPWPRRCRRRRMLIDSNCCGSTVMYETALHHRMTGVRSASSF